jgi:hypothetical protein
MIGVIALVIGIINVAIIIAMAITDGGRR